MVPGGGGGGTDDVGVERLGVVEEDDVAPAQAEGDGAEGLAQVLEHPPRAAGDGDLEAGEAENAARAQLDEGDQQALAPLVGVVLEAGEAQLAATEQLAPVSGGDL